MLIHLLGCWWDYKVRIIFYRLFSITNLLFGDCDPGDAMLNMHLMATWPKICQAMGPEFEPCLPVVMPLLIRVISTGTPIFQIRGDVTNRGLQNGDKKIRQKDLWELPPLRSPILDIQTSVVDEKRQAFQTLAIFCSTLQGRFAPYVSESLQLALSEFGAVIGVKWVECNFVSFGRPLTLLSIA